MNICFLISNGLFMILFYRAYWKTNKKKKKTRDVNKSVKVQGVPDCWTEPLHTYVSHKALEDHQLGLQPVHLLI